MSVKWFGFLMMAAGSTSICGAAGMSGKSFEAKSAIFEVVLGAAGVLAFMIGSMMVIVAVLTNVP
jgi:hypothetical protein